MKRDTSDLDEQWGARLRRARLASALSQRKLGVDIGLDESAANARINRYETGVHRPDLLTVSRIADVLGIPVAYFYADTDELADLIYRYGRASAAVQKSVKKLLADVPGLPPEAPLKHSPGKTSQ
jgi:transcriptional regulator with XRE-family HTH domain